MLRSTPSGASAPDAVARRQATLKKALAKRGLRNTRQREVLTEIFFGSDRHFSLEELLSLARERDDNIGYATVYRTLKLLTELGLAQERHFSDGQTRYEASDGLHHDHLICTGCGAIVEFEDDRIEHLQEEVAAKYGYVLVTHRMELYGLCPSCREKESQRNE
jgi:Fur family transcriptional regulator, ferric uptake regulator